MIHFIWSCTHNQSLAAIVFKMRRKSHQVLDFFDVLEIQVHYEGDVVKICPNGFHFIITSSPKTGL